MNYWFNVWLPSLNGRSLSVFWCRRSWTWSDLLKSLDSLIFDLFLWLCVGVYSVQRLQLCKRRYRAEMPKDKQLASQRSGRRTRRHTASGGGFGAAALLPLVSLIPVSRSHGLLLISAHKIPPFNKPPVSLCTQQISPPLPTANSGSRRHVRRSPVFKYAKLVQ